MLYKNIDNIVKVILHEYELLTTPRNISGWSGMTKEEGKFSVGEDILIIEEYLYRAGRPPHSSGTFRKPEEQTDHLRKVAAFCIRAIGGTEFLYWNERFYRVTSDKMVYEGSAGECARVWGQEMIDRARKAWIYHCGLCSSRNVLRELFWYLLHVFETFGIAPRKQIGLGFENFPPCEGLDDELEKVEEDVLPKPKRQKIQNVELEKRDYEPIASRTRSSVRP